MFVILVFFTMLQKKTSLFKIIFDSKMYVESFKFMGPILMDCLNFQVSGDVILCILLYL